jgi:DNA-binding CsgD family transcriptional regulator
LSLNGLLDRERELKALCALVDSAAAGSGGLVLVEGPAGIGKTRLLAAGGELAAGRGLRVLTARGSELERDFPFGAVRQLLEPFLDTLGDAERERLFEGRAALALPLFAQVAAGDPDYATLYGLYWLLVAISQDAPLLICVDDVHWLDAPSLRFLGFLARRIDGMRLMLCGALRPAEPGTDRALLSELSLAAATIRPAPLTEAGAGALIGAALNTAPEPGFVRECLSTTGGNPYYLGALAHEAAARGLAPTDAAATGVRELGPEEVSRLLLRRLAALGPGAPELARALAVLGDGASLQEATLLAGIDRREAAAAADALARASIAEGTDRLGFVHPIVRTSIYRDVPTAELADLHRVAAGLLADHGADLDRVAAQLLVAGAPDAWATNQLRAAARRAFERGAPENAAAYTRRALDGEVDGELRVALLQELAAAEAALQDVSAIPHLEEARRLASDPLRRARIATELAETLIYAGRWDAAVALGQAALDELGDRDDELSLRLRTMSAAAATYDPDLVGGLEPQLDELHEAALGDAKAARPLALLLAAIHANRGTRMDEVARLVEHGLDGGRFLADEHAEAWAAPQALFALIAIDALDRAERLVDEMFADAARRGSVRGFIVATGSRSYLRASAGHLGDVEADLRAGLALAQEHGLVFGIPSGLRYGTDALLERPEMADVAALAHSLELPPALASTVSGAWMLELRARLWLQAGETERGIEALRRAGLRFEALRFRNPIGHRWRSTLALALGDDEGRELAESELEDARRTGLPRAIGVSQRTLGVLDGDADRLRKAVELLERSPARLEHARALVELGVALRAGRQPVAAREPLRAGLDLAQRCGAQRLAERASGELRATGARPRREALSGRAALTASELRTARMAAAGLSNPAIAQALFVTVKTVEGHLSGAYRKLDVRSRSELPQALAD